MGTTLFVLGLSGSGKSTVSRHIVNYIQGKHIERAVRHINDYDILLKKFVEDIPPRRFRSMKRYKGFSVKDPTVYDEALAEVEDTANLLLKSDGIATVEFVRRSYVEAFKLFERNFVVNNSYFLFLDTDVATCKRRIHRRIQDPKSSDDHYVPNRIFSLYDVRRNKFYIRTGLKADFGIDDSRITVIQNKGELQDILPAVEEFINLILKREGIMPLMLVGQRKEITGN